MPYLRLPFEHDVFVSYAHGRAERESGVPGIKHWTKKLEENLRGDIVDFNPEFADFDVFIDTQLDPTLPLSDEIRRKVASSALLLVIMSDWYLHSVWCGDEREWFAGEIARRGIQQGVVIVVRAHPTRHENWPDFFKDERGHVVIGFQFHPDARDGEQIRPLGWPEPLPQDRPYFQILGKLSTIVIQRLRQLRKNQELAERARTPSVDIRISGTPCIYLLAPGEQSETWTNTKAALESAGCRVLPETLSQPDGNLAALMAARQRRLLELRDDAHAMCLVRPPSCIGIEHDLSSLVSDRTDLEAFFDKRLPCAVINQADDDVPQARELGIDVIDARGDAWLVNLQAWLGKALAPAR